MSTLQNLASPVRRNARRKAAAAGTVAAMAVGLTLAFGAPAQANSQPSYYNGILRSWAQGNCLDIQPGTSNVYTSGCVSGDVWQDWSVALADGGSGTSLITNDATGQCLDVKPGTWNGSTGALYVSNCVPGDIWQQWLLGGNGTSAPVWNIENSATSACLDANQPQALPYINSYCYSGGYQDWKPGF
ncbi:RICIN domain-containing protein [Streptacidiphilus fuscans]|uniref:Ricin-type beta-trefoil lectin domain protein n=1 Tax=Streptacidiphilus fuscans TaxID=2789292 RepID=A0A931B008_9ACTN|nr:RICIN domain-containing protein [Streptacidiphilus fuscans]MBF9066622.1 ricin-type beta-trefoil lectin domain protein [Streptacidiphilus fuscans]